MNATNAPLCFVLMPFGIKTDGNKQEINFDTVYNSFIKPSIIMAGLEPIRADEEKSGGFIHKPMYERLMFCEFAVADLSFANANVFYELGIRHALKPYTTVSIFEKNTKLPFDTAPLRTRPYNFENGAVQDLETNIKSLAEIIKINVNTANAQKDSPIAQMITNYHFPDLAYLKEDADAFREWVNKTQASKEVLIELVSDSRNASEEEKNKIKERVKEIEEEAGSGLNYDYGLLYALLNSYKSMNAFPEIVELLKPILKTEEAQGNIFLQQQLALAYNKIEKREESKKILTDIINKFGPDSETNGLLGAVYKGLMDDGFKSMNAPAAKGYRRKAADAYLAGFDADPRDYYPGVNALTLMFMFDEHDQRFDKFMPLVKYAVERQLLRKPNDYWAHASALELSVLEMNSSRAEEFLSSALACEPDEWSKNSTLKNLQLIYNKTVVTAGESALKWLQEIIQTLKK